MGRAASGQDRQGSVWCGVILFIYGPARRGRARCGRALSGLVESGSERYGAIIVLNTAGQMWCGKEGLGMVASGKQRLAVVVRGVVE